MQTTFWFRSIFADFLFLGAVTVPWATAGTIKTGKEMQEILSQKNVKAEVIAKGEGSWDHHIKELLSSSGATGGIVEIETKLKKHPSLRAGKEPIALKDMLDEVAQQNPSYRWTADGGAITILPKDMKKEPLAILDKFVKEFHVRATSSMAAIFELLKQNQFPVSLEPFMGGPKPKRLPEEKDYSCRNTTVLNCMNALAALDEKGSWHLKYDQRRGGDYFLTRLGEASHHVDDEK